jgi:uncharacterized protein YkwD
MKPSFKVSSSLFRCSFPAGGSISPSRSLTQYQVTPFSSGGSMRAFYVVAVILSICCGFVLAANDSYLNANETFLELHNFVRSSWYAQPLNWSTTLTANAQKWASGCRFEHTNGKLGPYGENIAAGTGNFTASDAMKMFMAGLGESFTTSSAVPSFNLT